MKSEAMEKSAKFMRMRKFLLIAPVIVVPMVVLLLWTVGLVGDAKAGTQKGSGLTGLNLNLPAAAPSKDSNWNKLRYYEQAEKDSQKLKMQLKSDPFFKDMMAQDNEDNLPMNGVSEAAFAEHLYNEKEKKNRVVSSNADLNEQKVYERLSKLQQELDREPRLEAETIAPQSIPYDPEVEKLQGMMQQMQSQAGDPELGQLDQMLDKIIAIQNPDKVQEELRAASEKRKGMVFQVQSGERKQVISTLAQSNVSENNAPDTKGFFSNESQDHQKTGQQSVNAVIHQTQTVVNGATVKLRLVDDIYINGILVPKETFIYGVAHLNGERLNIAINSIRFGSQLLPVQLSVYDMDGLAGVCVPGAISREVIQQGTDRGLQGLGFATASPSIGMQAASLGVEAAKTFLSKKVKLVRVTVKAGYQVLLRDEKQKNE